MSKLKVAKAVRAGFKIGKWLSIAAAIGLVIWLLCLWANAHFLSFAIVIGIVVAVLLLGAIVTAYEWSAETIEQAEKEELKAQERHRKDKLLEEHPNHFPASFDEAKPKRYGTYPF